jgi:hypothetical protein
LGDFGQRFPAFASVYQHFPAFSSVCQRLPAFTSICQFFDNLSIAHSRAAAVTTMGVYRLANL